MGRNNDSKLQRSGAPPPHDPRRPAPRPRSPATSPRPPSPCPLPPTPPPARRGGRGGVRPPGIVGGGQTAGDRGGGHQTFSILSHYFGPSYLNPGGGGADELRCESKPLVFERSPTLKYPLIFEESLPVLDDLIRFVLNCLTRELLAKI